MARLLHELWRQRDPRTGWQDWRSAFCLAGREGDAFRQSLTPDWLCTMTFEANNRAQAITQYAHWEGPEKAPAIQPQDIEPYPDEWAERQHGLMSDAELHAYGDIAQALADHAFDMAANDRFLLDKFPGMGPVYWHVCMSAFEWTAETLCRLRILRPIEGEAQCFVFDCDLKDARSVAVANHKSGPLLRKLIENFIYLYDDFGGGSGFSSTPDKWFGLNSRLEPVFESLAAIGYLEKSVQGFRWTPLAATAMYSTWCWPLPEEGQPA